MEPMDCRGPIVIPSRKVHVEAQRVEAHEPMYVPPPPKAGSWGAEWIWTSVTQEHSPEKIQEAVNALPEEYRKVLILSEGDFSYEEIAQITGLSVPAVKTRLHRARFRIRQHLEPFATLFRRVIDLELPPERVCVYITADTRYRLYVNGILASRGPADVGRDYDAAAPGPWLYDNRDLSHLFNAGRNVVAVEVYSKPLVSSEGTSGNPGLLLEAEIALPDGTAFSIGSDTTTWKAIPAPHVFLAEAPQRAPTAGVRCYHIDTQLEPVAWQSARFDDSDWPPAILARGSRASPLPSEIPPMLEAVYPAKEVARVSEGIEALLHPGGKAMVRITRDGTFGLRYDRVVSGYIGMHIKGVAGAVITLMPNETNTLGFHRTSRLILREGEQYIELPYFDSFSVINVHIEGVTAPVEIKDLRTVFTSYPVAYRGSFTCDDPHWNSLWNASRWALQLCLQTHHLDSPHHQEPICDPGDYLIEAQMNYYAFGGRFLARQDLRKFARILRQRDYRNFHTSYALLWLQMLLEYYEFTGDADLLVELAPTVHGLLDTFTGWRGKNGLVSEAPTYMFLDWVDIRGFPGHHPPAVIGQGYMTAFYYRGLADASRVAELTGDTQRVEKYRALRGEVATAFQRELWDEAKGLYRDGRPFQTSVQPGPWLPADTDIETHTPHVNTLAVAYDLAPRSQHAAILERVLSEVDERNVQPYFMHFVFEALHHAGILGQHAPDLLKRWRLNEDTGTFLEMWTTGDYSHAWGGTPLIQMSRRVLGVGPLTPGYGTVAIHPTMCGLQFAEGTVPTPRGEVTVSWKRAPVFTLTVDSPVPATVTLPVELGQIRRIKIDGKEQALSSQEIVVTAGRHQFQQ